MRVLDQHDRALLTLLQRDALLTAEALAERVALSPSAITRRVRRMRQDGTIALDAAILAENVGSFLWALVDVQMDRHGRDQVEALLQRLAASPHVQSLLEVTGAFDLALTVVVADMAAFNAFADATLAADPAVRRYETRFVKKRVKASLALPLE